MIWELFYSLFILCLSFVGVVVGFIGAFIFSELKHRVYGAIMFIAGVVLYSGSLELL